MITIEQIEQIAKNYDIGVHHAESGKGGFIVDDSGRVYESLNDIFMEFGETSDQYHQKCFIVNETVLYAA